MELYDSVHKLIYDARLVTWWDYTKFFFLTVAAIAAIWEMRNMLVHVLD